MISNLRPEHQLLLGVARRQLNESTAQSLRELLNLRSLDWEYVLDAAASHGLTPLLSHHLRALDGRTHLPASVLSRLENENHENSQRAMWMVAELVRIASALDDAGIRYVAFKGPALAISVYEDLGLRPFTDLDLLVSASEVINAKDVLRKLAFTPVRNLTRRREAALRRFDNALAFVNQRDTLVDLHWRFMPLHFSLSLDTEDLWSRLEHVKIGNHSVSTMSVEDLLTVLCCHGFTHDWQKLIWICDIATLVNLRTSFDWDYLLRKAKRLGVLRITMAGLAQSVAVGASLPPQVLQMLRDDDTVNKLARELNAQVLAPHDTQRRSSVWLKDQLRMRERIRDKTVTLLRMMITPRDYDLTFVSLPAWLGFLYYVIRPMRMGSRLAARVFSGSSQD